MGGAVGSVIGGNLIKMGRRRTAILTNMLAIISSAICMYDTTWSLTLGRFLLGIAGGVANIIYCKSINENYPEKLSSLLAMFCNASICIGLLVAFSMGAILPDPKDVEANKKDELWRVIYLMPAMIGLVEIILILGVFRYDPIAFCISKGFEEEGKLHML